MMKSTFKTAIKFLLVAIISLSSKQTHAAKWSDSGSYTISWYNKTATDFYISSASELAGMAYLVNNNFTSFFGQTIHLSADINLSGKEWIPISSGSTVFQGAFDGEGHTISNVSITAAEGYYCSFWESIKNTKVSDLTIGCNIESDELYVGAIAAQASKTTFENVEIRCSVVYNRPKVSGSTSFTYKIYVGGGVAYSTDCNFNNVKANNSVRFTFGSSTGSNCYGGVGLYIGGIVGYGENNVYEKCQATNDFYNVTLYGYEASNYYSGGSSSIYIGGIVGYDASSYTKIVSCLATNSEFNGYHYQGNYDTKSFTFGGIGGRVDGTIKNCVAITRNYSITGHDYSWVASWYHTSSTFGGIACGYSNIGGCYSNSDVVKKLTKVGYDGTGKNGSTSYSESGINSQAFVDEINLYSQLTFDETVWGLDSNGKLTLLDEKASAIEKVNADEQHSITGYYDLHGRKLSAPTKGISIVKYSDGTCKKVFNR